MSLVISDINIKNEESIAKVRANLLKFSQNQDMYALYQEQAAALFKAAGVPVAKIGAEDSFTVKSIVNGIDIYAVCRTTEQEYGEIKEKAETAGKLWRKMPMAVRKAFFSKVLDIGGKYKPLVDLLITVEVGKAGSEYAKAAQWDKYAIDSVVSQYFKDKDLVSLPISLVNQDIYVQDVNGKIYDDPDDIGTYDTIFLYGNYGEKQSNTEKWGGSGIVGGTCSYNYPCALIMPDIVLSRIMGLAFIGKNPSKAPSFLYVRKMIEEEAIDEMAKYARSEPWFDEAKDAGVDVSDPTVIETLKGGFGIINGRNVVEKWAKDCSVFRLVGSSQAGSAYLPWRKEVDPDLQHTIFELAGNNPCVIMASAKNLDGGLESIVVENYEGNRSNSGQRCTSPRRWLVEGKIYDEVEALAVAAYSSSADNKDGAIGNPLDLNSRIGAMPQKQFEEAMEYLEKSGQAGAKIIGGKRILLDEYPDAYFMTPALVLWKNADKLAKNKLMHGQEVFAPIANLDRVGSLQEAIDATNLSTQSLSGAFYCDENNLHQLKEFYEKTKLGSVIHNGPPKDQSPAAIHAGSDDGGFGQTGGAGSLRQYDPDSKEPAWAKRVLVTKGVFAKNFLAGFIKV